MIPLKCNFLITEATECFLNESLSAFEGQYELSQELADIVYQLMQDKTVWYRHKTNSNDIFNIINLN